MDDNDYGYGSRTYDNSKVVEVSSKIMIATIIVLFMVIVFIVFLHLYAKRYWIRRANGDNISSESQTSTALHRGLEPSVIESLPVLIFNTKDFKDGLECSVCLCEVSDGEKARLLPKCNHGFHIECIDMWFQSHSTCPLCRNSLVPESPNSSTELTPIESSEENSGNGFSILSPNLPTNVLFWGNQMQVSSGGGSTVKQGDEPSSSSSSSVSNGREGRLMIEIPRQLSEGFSSSGIEESKSPIIERLRSLKRLLIRENSDIQCSPGSVDVELGRGQCSKIGSNS